MNVTLRAAWFCPGCQKHHAPHCDTCPAVGEGTQARPWHPLDGIRPPWGPTRTGDPLQPPYEVTSNVYSIAAGAMGTVFITETAALTYGPEN